MVLSNCLQLEVGRNVDFGINLVQLTLSCILSLLLPVDCRVTLDWLCPELPGTFNTGVFFHCIPGRTIVIFNWGEVRLRTVLFQLCDPYGICEVKVELNMDCTLLTFLNLPVHVTSTTFGMPQT